MNKNLSLDSMTLVFSLEKAEDTLKTLIERDIIASDHENYNTLKNVLMELEYVKERISANE